MKKNIKVSIAMLVLVVLTVSAFSYAWFMENMNIEVSGGENVNISVGGNLEIAWHSTDPQWSPELKNDVNDIAMLDCSGNGSKFYVGEVGQDGTIANGSMREIAGDALDGSVLEFAIDLRTTQKMDVYLGSLSDITPKIPEYLNLQLPENQGKEHNNSLSGGEFSADWIAASARVAIYEVEYNAEDKIASETLKFIWIPHADVELSTDSENKYILETDAPIPLNYEYCEDIDDNGDPEIGTFIYDPTATYNSEEETDSNNSNKILLAQGDQLCTSDKGQVFAANQSPKIASFDGTDGSLQVKHLVIRIWFEGYDNECTEVMLGGKVKYTISLVGMLKKSELKAEQKTGFVLSDGNGSAESTEAIYYSGNATDGYTLNIPESQKGKLIFSKDGISYNDLAEGTKFAAGEKVYLRIKETADTYQSKEVLEIDFPSSNS